MAAEITRVQNKTSKMYQHVRQIQTTDKSQTTAGHQMVSQINAYKLLANAVHRGLV
jgi:hypothetical protein